MKMLDVVGHVDLTNLHAVLCMSGILFSVWCHQLWGRDFFGAESSHLVRSMQRMSFIVLAVSLCWSLSYAHIRNWQPWPSYILTLFAINLFLFSILVVAGMKRRLMG